jgi:hypothetical protein
MWLITLVGIPFIFELWVIWAYYLFFTFFFIAVVMRVKMVREGCGFLDSVLPKSLFYVL